MGWSTNTPLPYNAYVAGAVEYNGKVYIVGGYDSSSTLDTVTEYDPAGTGSYTTLSSLNTARYTHAIGIHGSTIIVAGGYGGGELNSVEIYDIEDDAAGWTTKTSMPEVNSGLTGVVYGDYFYTFGGTRDTVCKCDINNNFSWTTPISSAGVGGDHPSVEAVGDFIWVIGGDTDRTAVRKYNPNPSIDDWVTGSYTVAPSDVHYAASCVKGTKIYIAGGFITTGVANDLRSFDTAIPTDPSAWDDTLDNMPTGRYCAVGAKANNNFYVIGGHEGSSYSDKNESYSFTPPTPPTNPGGDINPYKTRVRG